MADDLDLNGREFDLVFSTASEVDPDAPTRFHYREIGGIVWGEYAGDTVMIGRFTGVRLGEVLTVSFVHRMVTGGPPVQGSATSRIEVARGGLRLVEDFETDGKAQRSVCTEVLLQP